MSNSSTWKKEMDAYGNIHRSRRSRMNAPVLLAPEAGNNDLLEQVDTQINQALTSRAMQRISDVRLLSHGSDALATVQVTNNQEIVQTVTFIISVFMWERGIKVYNSKKFTDNQIGYSVEVTYKSIK